MFRALLLFTAAALADPNHHAPEGSTWFCLRFIQKLTEHDEVVHTLPAAAAPTKAIVDKLGEISATDISYGVFVKGLPNARRLAVIDPDRTPHALIRDGKMLGIMFDVGTDATHRFAYHRRINHYWTILKFQLPDDNKFWNDNFRKTFLKDLMTPFEIKNFVDGFTAENDVHCDTLPKVTEGDSKQNAAIKSLSSKVYPVKNIISFYANADFKKTSIGKFTALWDHFKADIECPDEIWSDFGEWEQCSKSCGGGTKSKSRTCYMGNPGDEGCPGPATISATCNPQACSTWGTWEEWGGCDQTCGSGVRSRVKTCNKGPGGENCQGGNGSGQETCNAFDCPIYDQWSSWGECSATCGTGTRSQTQICNRGSGDKDCVGQPEERVESCIAKPCTIITFTRYENSYLRGYPNDKRQSYDNVGYAQEQCEANPACGGVTLTAGGNYDLRAGSTIFSSASGETSWLKVETPVG